MGVTMKHHEQRVIDEREELLTRLNKLWAFFGTSAFGELGEAEKIRMKAQASFMSGYLDMLQERIKAFAPPPARKPNGIDSCEN